MGAQWTIKGYCPLSGTHCLHSPLKPRIHSPVAFHWPDCVMNNANTYRRWMCCEYGSILWWLLYSCFQDEDSPSLMHSWSYSLNPRCGHSQHNSAACMCRVILNTDHSSIPAYCASKADGLNQLLRKSKLPNLWLYPPKWRMSNQSPLLLGVGFSSQSWQTNKHSLYPDLLQHTVKYDSNIDILSSNYRLFSKV